MIELILWFILGASCSLIIWRMENGKYFDLIHLFLCLIGTLIAPITALFVLVFFIIEWKDDIDIPVLWKKREYTTEAIKARMAKKRNDTRKI
jgi:purine-cytosine permease-like protein